MKRITKAIVFISLLLLVLVFSTSCQHMKLKRMPEDERALAVLELASEKLEKANGYDMESSLEITTEKQVQTAKAITNAKEIVRFKGEDEYTYHRETTVMVEKGNTTTDPVVHQRGYQNGKMYLVSGETRFYSITKLEQFVQMQELISEQQAKSSVEFGVEDVEGIGCEREDGVYIITLKDFTESGIRKLSKQIPQLFLVMEEIESVAIVVTVDEKFHINSCTMEIVSDNIAGMKMETTYSNYDSSEPYEEIDFEGFKSIYDLRGLYYVEHAMRETLNESSGTFEIETSAMGERITTNGTFVDGSTGYEYDIVITAKDYVADVKYKDGTETTTISLEDGTTETQTNEISEGRARALMGTTLNPASFEGRVIKRYDYYPNTQRIILEFEDSVVNELASTITSAGGRIVESSDKVIIFLEDDKSGVRKYRYEIGITYSYSGSEYHSSATTEIVFNQADEQ